MPVGWEPVTTKIEELIAEEQAKIDAIKARREWQAKPLPITQPTVQAPPETTPTWLPPVSQVEEEPIYIPPQLPKVGKKIPQMGKQIPDTYIPPRLPATARAFQGQPIRQTEAQRGTITPATAQVATETPLWKKGLQTFTAPFDWISKNITKPFGAVVTSPFTSPEGLTRQSGESWLDFEKRQYERLNPALKFGIEALPWFLIPGAGQVGTATRAGVGIAGALGRAGQVGKVLGKTVELSPWGLTEKATGKVISTILGKKAIPTVVKEVDPIVTKFTRLIKEFKPSTGATLKLQHEARRQQAAKIANIFATQKPSVAFIKAKGALKGTLPEAIAPAFEQMTVPEITKLQGMIQNFQPWERLPFNKVATEDAFQGLLHGIVPTRSETGLLETVFGSEMVKAILSKRSLGRKAFDLTMDAAGIPKALVSSFDISFPARQGILLIGDKSGVWWKSWKPMMQALVSNKNASTIEQNILNRPLAQYDKTIGIDITAWGRASAGLERFEESFMSRLANWFPWVRASSRAYTTFGNKLRTDTSDYYLGRWLKEMPKAEALAKAKRMAGFINKATGRGRLGGLERSGEAQQILNAAFFSPRFVMSRFQAPFTVFQKDPTVRKIIARDLGIFFGSGMAALTLAKLGGASVELDPRSTDFGKIKIGKTRIDFWGGFQPMARYVAQFVTAERKAVSGVISPVGRLDVAGRFIESKLSPTTGLILDALRGQNFIGEPVELTNETLKREAYGKLVPMFLQDLIDATREQGLVGTGLALPSVIGGSVTTYPVGDPMDEMAQQTYGKSFGELSPAQKGDIRNLPEVRARLRPTKSEKESYKLYDQQLEDDQAFVEGILTNEQWRDRMYDRLAIRSYTRKQWEGKYPQPTTPEEIAQAGYYAIFEKLGENAMPNEVKAAMQEAEQYLAALPPELADYIEENRWSNSTPLMKEFKQAQKLLRPYWAVEAQVIRLFYKGNRQRYEQSPSGQRLVAKRRKQMRRTNREVALAYEKFYASE